MVPFNGDVVSVANVVGVDALAAARVGLHKCSDAALGARRFRLHQVRFRFRKNRRLRKNRAVRDHFFRMGKHPTHHGGKGAAKGAVCLPSRGKTCGLELAKVKRMGFKVFAFRQRSEDGDSERVRYVYASEKETIRCRRELLQRPREERSAIDLSAVIDDDSVFGVELVNDVRSCQRDRVRRRNVGDDGHGIHRAAGRGLCHAGATYANGGRLRVHFVPSGTERHNKRMRRPLQGYNFALRAGRRGAGSHSEGEEHFFDSLRDWVWYESVTRCV